MKIIRTLDVTSTEFFDYLEDRVLNDVLENTGNRLNHSSVKGGLTYTKHYQKAKTDVVFKIDQYIRGEKYQLTSRSVADTVTVTYLTEPEEEKTKVTLIEDIDSYQPDQHNRILGWFSQALMLGRMSSTLLDMETDIIKNRAVKEA
ncbi:MAG: DUF3284 domain-containing protein [Schleiferilactobacillus harbinensis]|jgi:hypothetical protein|nr:DUF3284 domain-containing protein [Schleiferilactobacillus harbinensis]MCI1911412.1 DUF3284 domain-containing protein [Schleiferilactobacillus harbinensis]